MTARTRRNRGGQGIGGDVGGTHGGASAAPISLLIDRSQLSRRVSKQEWSPEHRGKAPPCRDGGRERAPSWASLHVDLLQLIAAWVPVTGRFLDYVRLRAVCFQWRAAAPCKLGRGLLDPRRWMMFPEGFGRFPGHRAHGGHARFFDLSAGGAFVRVNRPLLSNHCVLDSPDGLLLLLQRDEDTSVRLLHPFTGDVAEFPSLDCLAQQLHHLENELTWRGRSYNSTCWMHMYALYLQLVRKVCAADNVTAAGVVTVMLVLENFGHRGVCVGWR